jgi:phosphoenolpyruvate phosphomutase
MHSKKKDPSDIVAFMKHWQNRAPVVIVPTNYYKTPTDEFRKMGVSMVIWANHNMRSAVTAMQHTSKFIHDHQTLVGVEEKMVSVKEVFRLQRDDELRAAEDKYLPKHE